MPRRRRRRAPAADPGLAGEAYRHDGQLTKRDVRAVTLARLAPCPGELLWDVGAVAAPSASNGCARTPVAGRSPSKPTTSARNISPQAATPSGTDPAPGRRQRRRRCWNLTDRAPSSSAASHPPRRASETCRSACGRRPPAHQRGHPAERTGAARLAATPRWRPHASASPAQPLGGFDTWRQAPRSPCWNCASPAARKLPAMREETPSSPRRCAAATVTVAPPPPAWRRRACYDGTISDAVQIVLPKGQQVLMRLGFCRAWEGSAEAGTLKDAGDDPDVTRWRHNCSPGVR